MPYDEKLAARLRVMFEEESDVAEKKMFGGLAFLVNGNMSVTVSAKGGILARVDPAYYETFATESGVDVAVMRGKPMTGWLRVSAQNLRTKTQLKQWFDRCVSYSGSLPKKG